MASPPDFCDIAGALLLRQSLIIAAAAIALAIVLQLALGLWLTRHLRQLIAAGEAMAAGDLSTRVPVRSDDEVGQLAAAFNTMAQSIADRIRELRASEAKFHAIADYSYGCELWLSPHGKLLWINYARGDGHRLHADGMPCDVGLPVPAGIAAGMADGARSHRRRTAWHHRR